MRFFQRKGIFVVTAAVLTVIALGHGLSCPKVLRPAVDPSTIQFSVVQLCTKGQFGGSNPVLCVATPVHARANASFRLLKVVGNGGVAIWVMVKFGGESHGWIEVLQGLSVGDKVIVSDMSAYENVDRVSVLQ
jgi:hypothetical protein